MTNRIDVMEAMDAVRISELRTEAFKKQLRGVLKSYALIEMSSLCKKHPGVEVMFTSLPHEATLYVSGVPRKTDELSKRFNAARNRGGVDAVPLGVFLGLDRAICFRPMACSK